ncbi:hypothetical protein [Streptomyces sp. NBC_01353]|uniref:hypothetical protein n=1 Tax=Streptomyces sp. NBC_01353 TaxID=2903835 RepID=UPI002E3667E2|nr:hypothetical protein [Streptomyces sp. NBC_01353]
MSCSLASLAALRHATALARWHGAELRAVLAWAPGAAVRVGSWTRPGADRAGAVLWPREARALRRTAENPVPDGAGTGSGSERPVTPRRSRPRPPGTVGHTLG